MWVSQWQSIPPILKVAGGRSDSRPVKTRLNFTLERESSGSKARAATFQTLHGEVRTPIFSPVGTQATVKGQTVESLKASGSHLILANTYHLLLRPGPEVFKKCGCIHRFMNWDGPVLTDSGGFQIFSLPHSREMNEEGARFPKLRGWKVLSALARIQHRDATSDRQRHHDGSRSVHRCHRSLTLKPRRP
jgi:hypothetical protein